MSPYDYYITPEEYARAAERGVNRRLLNRRVREYGWGKERAITTPPRAAKGRKELLRIAARNGVSRITFQTRIARGWDAHRAATTPPETKDDSADRLRRLGAQRRIIPLEIKALAERNGISYDTLSWRILRAGWDPQRAATEPPWTHKKRAGYARQRYKEIYGHNFGEYVMRRG